MKIIKKNIQEKINLLDLEDINYLLSSEKINFHNSGVKPNYLKGSLIFSISLFFVNWLKKIIDYSISKKEKNKFFDVIFLSFTYNQKKTAESLMKFFPIESFYGNTEFGNTILPEHKANRYSLKYFFLTLKIYKQSKGYFRQSFKYSFWQYWLTYGYLVMLYKFFINKDVRVIVVSNDHIMRARISHEACQLIGAKSVYMQHASVTFNFPNLIFDYALLEGKDAFEKYKQIGNIKSTVFLVGNLKNKSTILTNISDKVQRVGICFGFNDLESRILEVIDLVKDNNLIKRIIIRPHPAEKRFDFIKKILDIKGVELSSSKNEHVDVFLNNVDCIIVGESNIHLEAISKNIESIYYPFSSKITDHYGFLKNGLIIEKTENLDDLKITIEKLTQFKPNVCYRAKNYDELIDTKYFGKSQELYSKVIKSIASDDFTFINETFNLVIEDEVSVYKLK